MRWGFPYIVLVIAGCAALLWTTRWGIGLYSDSAVYVAAARNLLAGNGLSWLSGGGEIRPMTLHAPLLSIILAGAEAVGIDAIAFARALNTACLGAAVLLVGGLAKKMTRSDGFALVAALVVAGAGELLRVHLLLMSEPLFIALTLAGALALMHYRQERRRLWLGLGSLAFGLAALARYGGLALPAAGALFLVIDPGTALRRRLVDGTLMLALAVTPSIAWMARNALLTGQAGGRSFGVHLDAWPLVRDQTVAIISSWFAPLRLVDRIMSWQGASAIFISLAGLGIAVLGILMLTRRARRTIAGDASLSGVVLVGACLLSYLAVAFFAALFSSPGADINERVLSPVSPLLWLVVVAGLAWVWNRRSPVLRVVVGLMLILLVRHKLGYEYWTIRGLGVDGLGYAGRAWRSSATIRALVEMNPGVIYTNDTAAIYLLADRHSYVVPWALPDYDPGSVARMEDQLRDVLLERDGAVVLFGAGDLPVGWSHEILHVDVQTDDGVIMLPTLAETG